MSEKELQHRLRSIERLVASGRKPGRPSPNGFRRVGLRVPEVRAMVKKGFAGLDDLSSFDLLRTWHHIYRNTTLYEVGCLAIYSYQHKSLSRAEFEKVRQWVNRCDCWEHSDDLSKIYAQVFEERPDWVRPWYEKWNRSPNPWHRRQSVVGLLEYAQKRKRVEPFEDLIGFVEPLLADDEYYVQKGVGWTLREIYNVYPKETRGFFNRRYTDIAPLAWSAATEKLDAASKKKLNLKRKQHRER